MVKVSPKKGIYIGKFNPKKEYEYYEEKDYDECVIEMKKYLGYWLGYDTNEGWHGNSILIKVSKNTYVWVGEKVVKFRLKNDTIIDFVSIIKGSDVAYPIAFGEKNLYFMSYMRKEPKHIFSIETIANNTDELWTEFYDIYPRTPHSNMDITVIHKRLD